MTHARDPRVVKAFTDRLRRYLAEDNPNARVNGVPLLHTAVMRGYRVPVQKLLAAGAEVNIEDAKGRTALQQLAVNAGGLSIKRDVSAGAIEDITALLLRNGARMHGPVESREGNLLHRLLRSQTAFGGVQEVVLRGMLLFGADSGSVDEEDNTALHVAARRGFDRAVRLLLHAGASTERFNRNNATPLDHAIEQGHARIVVLLLDAGAKSEGRIPLHRAVQCAAQAEGNRIERFRIVRLLAGRGGLDHRDSEGRTPLDLAREAPSSMRREQLLAALQPAAARAAPAPEAGLEPC